jgi:lipid-A-disaccharide synthase
MQADAPIDLFLPVGLCHTSAPKNKLASCRHHETWDGREGAMKIFFSVGEPSGDLHAANLIRALRQRQPDLEFVGYGGPVMAAAGCQLHTDLTALAVMWFARVLVNLHKFLDLLSRADRYFHHHRPDAVVLVDYPGFNWWIARRAKAHGIPVFYYAPPQIWAWGSWRVKKMRRFVDHVLCGLPFEEDWFRQHGCRATFVGHPFFDETHDRKLDQALLARERARAGRLVTILPGSRTQEVEHNLQWMLKTAALIHAQRPDVRFAIASFKPHQAEFARRLVGRSGLPVEVFLRRTPELIELADCCLAVSGSVSLELLDAAKPTVVLYWISRLAYFVQGFFRRTTYITLVNLLAAKELFPAKVPAFDPDAPGAEAVLFPEYLTCEDRSEAMARHLLRWLENEGQRQACIQRLMALREKVAHGGASARAADYILAELTRPADSPPRPHCLPAGQARAAARTSLGSVSQPLGLG